MRHTKHFWLLGIMFMLITVGRGQSSIRLNVGFYLLNELYAGMQWQTPSGTIYSVEAGFVIPFVKEAYYSPSGWDYWRIPLRAVNTCGLQVRGGFEIPLIPDYGKMFRCQVEYGRLWSFNFIHYPNRNTNSPTAQYAEFDESYNNYAVLLYYTRSLDEDNKLHMELLGGFRIKDIHRFYTIEGTASSPRRSGRQERLFLIFPVISVGCKYYFGKQQIRGTLE